MVKKGEKVEDPDYLAMLASAREKALAVRQQKAEEKKKIKLAKDLEHQQKLKEAEEKLKSLTTSSEEDDKPLVKHTQKHKAKSRVIQEVNSETDEEYEESETEDEMPPPKPRKAVSQPRDVSTQKHKHIPLHREKSIVGKPEMSIEQMRMMRAYQSLFDW